MSWKDRLIAAGRESFKLKETCASDTSRWPAAEWYHDRSRSPISATRLTEGERPHGRAGHGTADGVCGQDIGELVDTIGGEPLQVIELQDVNALLDEQIDVNRVAP